MTETNNLFVALVNWVVNATNTMIEAKMACSEMYRKQVDYIYGARIANKKAQVEC